MNIWYWIALTIAAIQHCFEVSHPPVDAPPRSELVDQEAQQIQMDMGQARESMTDRPSIY